MGTCSSVEMLKGYTVRERLGTPELYTKSVWHCAAKMSSA